MRWWCIRVVMIRGFIKFFLSRHDVTTGDGGMESGFFFFFFFLNR